MVASVVQRWVMSGEARQGAIRRPRDFTHPRVARTQPAIADSAEGVRVRLNRHPMNTSKFPGVDEANDSQRPGGRAGPPARGPHRPPTGLVPPPAFGNARTVMNIQHSHCASLAALAACGLLLAGCASSGVKNPSGVPVTEMRPDERGFVAGTGIESQDLVAVTDKMARSILGIPEIAHAPVAPRIVLDPVINETRFPINKEIFLTRIQTELNSKARGKVWFLARDRMAALERERALKQSGQVTSTSDPNVVEFKGADYFLTGKLQGLTTRTAQGTSDYILYAFELIDARTSEIVWQDAAEIKKQGLEDAAYR
jgi:PBP1b-binding outer membrane lipoprotein LpoB